MWSIFDRSDVSDMCAPISEFCVYSDGDNRQREDRIMFKQLVQTYLVFNNKNCNFLSRQYVVLDFHGITRFVT